MSSRRRQVLKATAGGNRQSLAPRRRAVLLMPRKSDRSKIAASFRTGLRLPIAENKTLYKSIGTAFEPSFSYLH